jgi:hypothetical protein
MLRKKIVNIGDVLLDQHCEEKKVVETHLSQELQRIWMIVFH